jgi:hypothetical protein
MSKGRDTAITIAALIGAVVLSGAVVFAVAALAFLPVSS